MVRKLTIEDLKLVRMVHDLDVDVNRGLVVFTVSKISDSINDYERNVWLYDGKSPRQLTRGNSDFSPRFLSDGSGIVFLSRRGLGKDEPGVGLWLLRFDYGEPVRLAYVRGGVSNVRVVNNEVFFLSNVGPVQEDVKVVEEWPLWFNGKGFVHTYRTHLFSLDLSGGLRQLTSGDFDVVAYDVRPGGEEVAVVVSTDRFRPYRNEIWLINLRRGERHGVLSNYSVSAVRFSPDGKYLAFVGNDLHRGLATHDHVFLVNLETNEVIDLMRGVDRSVGNSLNSDVRGAPPPIKLQWLDNYVYFVMMDGGTARLGRARVDGGVEVVIGGNRSIEDFALVSHDLIYFVAMEPTLPTELYKWVGGVEERVTNFNDWVNLVSLSRPEPFRFRASDGVEVEGWVMRPVDFHPGIKYPAVLEIHGGPKTAYGYSFMFEFQLLANEGFVVVFMNPRGSDGYSEEFADIRGHYGERDYEDLMEGLDYVLRNYDFIDPNRLGVIGGSYGGFMTNWIVTHTDRFRAAVTDRSISNWVSFFGTSDIGPYFANDQIGGGEGKDFWNSLEIYLAKSPIMYVRNVKTPLLIIHSLEDYRCWFDQAVQLYTALKYLGKEVKMVVFPGENHDLSRFGKPSHRIARLRAIVDWFREKLGS
ncbi:MAG: S9 family peptidase [Vulcanisaeta sp.]|nr:S9 family peptidase [Vulcanisaeta sp.]MCG2892683.1 S9 family peptidase [Vulcanisaeta sp.]